MGDTWKSASHFDRGRQRHRPLSNLCSAIETLRRQSLERDPASVLVRVQGRHCVHGWRVFLLIGYQCAVCAHALAVEGPTAAGPIGETDIRSAMLPPPGLYGGTRHLAAGTLDFVDGNGKTVPALRDAHLAKQVGGPLLYYVPDITVLGGSIGFGAIVPTGNQCGHLFVDQSDRCTDSIGDPYVELDWSRSFATVRPSKFAGAYRSWRD